MARRGKHKFFTAEGHPIAIYKKGKRHKVYVDLVSNQVVATNPLPLAALAAMVAPTILEKGKELLGRRAGSAISRRGFSPEQYPFPPRERLSIFEKALMAKALDR